MMIEVIGGPYDGDYWDADEKALDLETLVTPLDYQGNNVPQYRLTLDPMRKVLVYLIIGFESSK